jgi:hypothetical protein
MGSIKHREMIEGPKAFERLRDAMKAVLTVPKTALPPRKKQAKRKSR